MPDSVIISSKKDSTIFTLRCKNNTDSSIILYNFFADWSLVYIPSASPGGWSPGFKGGIWNPGVNIAIFDSMLEEIPHAPIIDDYINREDAVQIKEEAKQQIVESRQVLNPREEIDLQLLVKWRDFYLRDEVNYLYIYYEMNYQILKYVKSEPEIFWGRVQSNRVKLIVGKQ